MLALLDHIRTQYATDIESLSAAARIMTNGDIIEALDSFRVQEGIQESQGW